MENKINTRNEIIKTAARLFVANGYEKTSLISIARDLGITKGGIYHYFSSKEELLAAVLDFVFEDIGKNSSKVLGECDSHKMLLEKLFTSVGKIRNAGSGIFDKSPQSGSFALFLMDMSRKFPFVLEKTKSIGREIRGNFKSMIDEMKIQGILKNDIDSEALAFEIHALMEGFFVVSSLDDTLDMGLIGKKVFDNIWDRIKV